MNFQKIPRYKTIVITGGTSVCFQTLRNRETSFAVSVYKSIIVFCVKYCSSDNSPQSPSLPEEKGATDEASFSSGRERIQDRVVL